MGAGDGSLWNRFLTRRMNIKQLKLIVELSVSCAAQVAGEATLLPRIEVNGMELIGVLQLTQILQHTDRHQ